jgi:hypothetical protein
MVEVVLHRHPFTDTLPKVSLDSNSTTTICTMTFKKEMISSMAKKTTRIVRMEIASIAYSTTSKWSKRSVGLAIITTPRLKDHQS